MIQTWALPVWSWMKRRELPMTYKQAGHNQLFIPVKVVYKVDTNFKLNTTNHI